MPQFQHAFFHAKFAKSVKKCSKRDPLWRPRSTKSEQKGRLESNIKNTCKKLAKIMQNRRPNTSQNKHFAWKGCIFWVLQHLRKSVQNELKRHSEMTPKILQNAAGSLPKAMPKISPKNVTQKMQMKSILGQKLPKIVPKTGLSNFPFWGFS